MSRHPDFVLPVAGEASVKMTSTKLPLAVSQTNASLTIGYEILWWGHH